MTEVLTTFFMIIRINSLILTILGSLKWTPTEFQKKGKALVIGVAFSSLQPENCYISEKGFSIFDVIEHLSGSWLRKKWLYSDSVQLLFPLYCISSLK